MKFSDRGQSRSVELWRAIKLDKGIFAVSRSIASDISVRDKLHLRKGVDAIVFVSRSSGARLKYLSRRGAMHRVAARGVYLPGFRSILAAGQEASLSSPSVWNYASTEDTGKKSCSFVCFRRSSLGDDRVVGTTPRGARRRWEIRCREISGRLDWKIFIGLCRSENHFARTPAAIIEHAGFDRWGTGAPARNI